MANYRVLLILYFFFYTGAYSQTAPQIAWEAIYGDPSGGEAWLNDMQQDDMGNLYLTGRSQNIFDQDAFMIKYSHTGDTLLEIRYSVSTDSRDESVKMALSSNNDIILAVSSTDNSVNSARLQKYLANGQYSFEKVFENAYPSLLSINATDEVLFTHHTFQPRNEAHVQKFDLSGDTLWTITVSDNTYDIWVYSAVTNSDNHSYLLVYEQGGGSHAETFIIKLDSFGNILWQNPTPTRLAKQLKIDRSGNILLTSQQGFFVTKLLQNGDFSWEIDLGLSPDPFSLLDDIISDSENNIIVCGTGYATPTGGYVTKKLTPEGNVLWTRRFDSPDGLRDRAKKMTVDSENNIYVTGESVGSGVNFDGHAFSIKYSQQGVEEWSIHYDSPFEKEDRGQYVFVDSNENVYVGGITFDATFDWNFFLIKIDQNAPVGINIDVENPIADFSLKQNFPNPFNGKTIIQFSVPVSGIVNIALYDALGRKVQTLINAPYAKGKYSINWDTTAFPSGIYYYRMQFGTNSITRKAILQN